jgi:hypothetical protein
MTWGVFHDRKMLDLPAITTENSEQPYLILPKTRQPYASGFITTYRTNPLCGVYLS